METRPAIMIDFEIFTHKKIIELFRTLDNSLGFMGSGGYEVQVIELQENIAFVFFIERERAPALAYPIIVRGNVIYSKPALQIVSSLLIRRKID